MLKCTRMALCIFINVMVTSALAKVVARSSIPIFSGVGKDVLGWKYFLNSVYSHFSWF